MRNNDDVIDLDKFVRTPIKIELSGEPFEFKALSMKDTYFVMKLLKREDLNSKEFTILFLFNQIISPNIEFSSFKEILNDQLIYLACEYIKYDPYLSELYKENANFFEDVRLVLSNYIDFHFKTVSSSLSSINTFNITYPIMNKPIFQLTPLIDFNSLIQESTTNIRKIMFGSSYNLPLVNVSAHFKILSNLITSTIQPQIEVWNHWAESNSNLFRTFHNQQKNLFDNYSISAHVASASLKPYQWFITPSLPEDFIHNALIICEKDGNRRNEINQLYLDHFFSDDFSELNLMISFWESTGILKHTRYKIIDNCLQILKKSANDINPSYLIVPTLVAQIEGIEHELMLKENLNPVGGRWFDSEENSVNRSQFYAAQDIDIILDSARSILLEVLYQSAYPGSSLNSPINFNRHKIAHGELLNYGTKYNIIRSFLLLDFLIRLYATED